MMECKCGYKGLAEIGDFPDERWGEIIGTCSYRCPECKSNKNIMYNHAIDSIAEVIVRNRFRNVLQFFFEGADKNTIGFSITNPRTKLGHGSTITVEEFEMLRKKYPKYVFVGVNVDKVSKEDFIKWQKN